MKWMYCCTAAALLAMLLSLVPSAPALGQDDEDDLDGYITPTWATSLSQALADSGARYLRPSRLGSADELAALTKKKGLKGLRLSSVRLPDLQLLRAHPELEVLELTNCSIGDVTEIGRLKRLRYLVISYNPITDLSPLAGLPQLEVLIAARCLVADIAVVAQLPALRHLDLADNPIADISPLGSRPELTRLSLYKNKAISDLSVLAGLTELRHLNVSFGMPGALRPELLAPLTQLTNLRVQGDMLTPELWQVVGGLSALEQLTAGKNPSLTDLTPIAGLSNLDYLDIHGCAFSDLTPLSRITGLRKLVMNNNRVSSLAPLKACTRLTMLYSFGNPIKDIAALRGLPLSVVTLPRGSFAAPEQQAAARAQLPKGCRVRFM